MSIFEYLAGFVVAALTIPMFLLGTVVGVRGMGRYFHIKFM